MLADLFRGVVAVRDLFDHDGQSVEGGVQGAEASVGAGGGGLGTAVTAPQHPDARQVRSVSHVLDSSALPSQPHGGSAVSRC